MPTKKKVPATQEAPLSQRELARAATNDPSLSNDEFTIGGRTFKVLDLGYDEYVNFLALLQPLTEGLIGKLSGQSSFSIPDLQIDTSRLSPIGLMKYCREDLPEMARIVCAKTDPNITTEEVKQLAGNPITLAEIILKQVVRNNMIGQISRFFKLILTLMPKKNQK